MNHRPALEIEGLQVDLPRARTGHLTRIIDGVDLTVDTGEIVGLVGGSGCGKTTLARAALRLITPTAGKIKILGTDLSDLDRKSLRNFRRHMQMVFQDPAGSLNGRMRVSSLVAEPMIVHDICKGPEAHEKAISLLETCGLAAEECDKWPHQFSGGQKQRVAIARALATEPSLLFCDEPTSSLDVSVQARILNLLRRLQQERSLALVFITHDLSVARWLCDRIIVMDQGRIVEEGKTETILNSPQHAMTKLLLEAAD